jgi:hypothetical protein
MAPTGYCGQWVVKHVASTFAKPRRPYVAFSHSLKSGDCQRAARSQLTKSGVAVEKARERNVLSAASMRCRDFLFAVG